MYNVLSLDSLSCKWKNFRYLLFEVDGVSYALIDTVNKFFPFII